MTAVVTRSYGNDRAGVNPNETVLTAPAVAKHGIKRLWHIDLPEDARGCEAQPLIAPGITLASGQKHDLLIIATLANTVRAHDAKTRALLWKVTLGPPIKKDPGIDSWRVQDHWGILSTPVLDLARGMIYVCYWSSADESVAKARHYFAAMRLADGVQPRKAIDFEGVQYDPPTGPIQKFSSAARKQRASLLLARDGRTVHVPFGSIAESAASNRGWIVAVDLPSWMAFGWTSTVTGSGAGIWQAGSGLAEDSNGFLYAMTANGDFDGEMNFGQCFVKLRYTPPGPALRGSFDVVDWWAPFLDERRARPTAFETADPADAGASTAELGTSLLTSYRKAAMISAQGVANVPLSRGAAWDMDLGSGGPVLIEELGLLLGAGKDGILYAVRMHAMGKTSLKNLQTAAGTEANYRLLAHPPIWLTFFPGYATSDDDPRNPAPDDPAHLNYNYFGKTHHQHGSLIPWKSAQGWRLLGWGENSQLRLWSIEPLAGSTPQLPKVEINFLAAGEEVSSADAKPPQFPAGGMPGGFMCLCYDQARPAETPVLFATIPYLDANRVVSPGRLLAYDLTQFKEGPNGAVIPLVWDSATWNHEFGFTKFTPSPAANGTLYLTDYGVANENQAKIWGYGLA
jgi:hypothetical protein